MRSENTFSKKLQKPKTKEKKKTQQGKKIHVINKDKKVKKYYGNKMGEVIITD